jgi:hypothetical protein
MSSQENTQEKGLDSNMSGVQMTDTNLSKANLGKANLGKDSNQMINERTTEEQFAHGISSVLNEHSQHLTPFQLQRLAQARDQAVSKLSLQQSKSVQTNGNALQWLGHQMGDYIGHHRAMSTAMIAGVMMLTFFAAQQFDFNNNLENSDAFLLASELPPEAFADKGFDTWVDSKASY